VACATFLSFASFETTVRAEENKTTFASTGQPTSIPYGWLDFCSRQPQECNQPTMIAQNITLQSWTWKALNKINREVNAAIKPLSNLEHWGTIADHWDYPTDGKGDCKIYALQERKLLIEQGFPRQALLMTIVKDQNDEGHAVLTVVTSLGDFILDNMTNEIRPWEKTAYRFLKRQSQEDPNIWVAIEPPKQQRQLSLR
jgi:predicted transglutaminase-like cysteine proteinase